MNPLDLIEVNIALSLLGCALVHYLLNGLAKLALLYFSADGLDPASSSGDRHV